MSDLVDQPDDPFLSDPAVIEAVQMLRAALKGASSRHGRELVTMACLWASERDGDCFSGCLLEGDADPEVIELLAETLTDDSGNMSLPPELARRHS